MEYGEFLKGKLAYIDPCGFKVELDQLNENMKPHQKLGTQWALHRGRCALFFDTGLGKTLCELEYGRHVNQKTDMPFLQFTPLAVAKQMLLESERFGVKCKVKLVSDQSECINGINITNYDKMHRFDASKFGGICLDESSILKGVASKTRIKLNEFAENIPYRLAASATPAPNDKDELINHAEWLDIMSGKQMLAMYFVQDGNSSMKWKLKGHAEKPFWEFVSQWALAVRKPSDLGFDDDGYILPEPIYHEHKIPAVKNDGLLPFMAISLTDRHRVRKESLRERCEKVAEVVAKKPNSQWLIGCYTNDESDLLEKLIPNSTAVKGSDSSDKKEDCLLGFKDGKPMHLITKPSIAGHGMNYQHCSDMIMVGLSDSFEQLYQFQRRIWRYGQKKQVNIHAVISESEGAVVENIKRKEREFDIMYNEIVKHMSANELYQQRRSEMEYNTETVETNTFTAMLGDSCERLKEIPDNSIGLSVFSPPFANMYSYTNSARDIGNAKSSSELIAHLDHMTPELFRVMMPGRNVMVHLTQEVMFKKDHGYTGIFDLVREYHVHMRKHGFILKSERMIDKDPQVKSIRTRDVGLAMKTAATDSAKLTGTMPDYLLHYQKPGDNPEPIRCLINHPSGRADLCNPDGWVTTDEWIQWASCVWYGAHRIGKGGIRETDTLNAAEGRDEKDEKHLCPLQLGVIERCVKLWSAPGDTIFSPFMGIGSEGYMALKHKRKFIGIELKKSYFDVAVRNLKSVKGANLDLFDEVVNG